MFRERGNAFLAIFFVLTAAVTALVVFLWGVSEGDLADMEQDPGVVNMLLLGTDRNYGKGGTVAEKSARTDTIILACLNTAQGKAYLFSIPRDTIVKIPGHGTGLINAAHVFGGSALVVETVERLLDVNIPYWASVDFEGFQALIDALGGVEIEVEKDLKYYDRAGGFKIDLKAGRQVLSGEEALQYVRFRSDALGDIGRVRRQQKLLAAVAQKALRLDSVNRWPALYKVVERTVETNLTKLEMLRIGAYLKKVGLEKIETRTLPGNFSGSHWRLDDAAARELVAAAITP